MIGLHTLVILFGCLFSLIVVVCNDLGERAWDSSEEAREIV